MNKTKLIALLILVSSTASAYVIKETKSNEDFKVFVSPGGTPFEAFKITGASGEGSSIRNQGGTTLTLKKTGGGSSLSLWPGDVGTSNTYSMDNNGGVLRFYNHSAQMNGTVTQAGSWSIGPGLPSTVEQVVNGRLVVHETNDAYPTTMRSANVNIAVSGFVDIDIGGPFHGNADVQCNNTGSGNINSARMFRIAKLGGLNPAVSEIGVAFEGSGGGCSYSVTGVATSIIRIGNNDACGGSVPIICRYFFTTQLGD